jgi:cbb3-type cytochrome oxidase subunit 3
MSNQLSNENWKKYKNGNKDIKESFCGACIAIPFAFVGVGASAYGASSRGKYKKQKKWALWGGIAVTLISIAIVVYYARTCTDCGYTD